MDSCQNPYAAPTSSLPSFAIRGYLRQNSLSAPRAYLVKAGLLYRQISLEAPIEAVLEWRAYEPWDRILIDGQTMARRVCWIWFAPRFEFTLPSENAPIRVCIDVRVRPWLSVGWLRVAIDEQIVYEEGAATLKSV